MTSPLTHFYQKLIDYRILILLATAIIALIVGSGMGRLAFSNDYRDFFPPDDPNLLAFEDMEDTFVKTNNVFIGVRSKDGNIFTPKGLTDLAKLTDALWRLPHVIRVEGLANHQFIRAEDNTITLIDMVTLDRAITQEDATSFRKMSRAEESVNGLFASEDTSIAGINLLVSNEGVSETGKAELMAALTPLLEDNLGSQYETYLTGSIVIDHGFDVAAQQDLEVLYAAMYALVLVLAGILTRSIAATVGVLLLMTLSWVIALGFGAWVGVKLTAISVAAPTVLMTLSVAQAMHIVFGIQKATAKGFNRREAVVHAMVHNTVPLCLVSITTGMGFVAIIASEVPPLRDLGIILSIGVMALLALSIVFLPLFLSYFDLGSKSTMRRTNRQMIILGRFVAKYNTPLAITIGLLVLLAAFAVPLNRINDNFIEYFDTQHVIYTDAMSINDRLTGVHHAYIRADSVSGSVFDPAFLAEIDHFSDWLEEQENVRHVDTYSDTLKRLNMAMHADSATAYTLVDSREEAVELNLLYELSLPFGQSTENVLSFDRDATKITLVLDNLDSSDLLVLEQKIAAWSEANAKAARFSLPTGPMSMFAHIGQRNARGLLTSTGIALASVSVVLMLAFRSVTLGLISMIPNVLPALLAFGVWGLIDGQVGLAVSIVTVMTFGIVVDDTIFLLTRFREHIRPGNFTGTLVRTMRDTGRPIVNTSIILVAGFSLLSFSSFRLNEGLGILTALVIAFALICDLLFLPALLRCVFFRSKSRKLKQISASQPAE